jgi:hypothetical protein
MTIPTAVSLKLDSLLGGTLATGAALLKANSQTRWAETPDGRRLAIRPPNCEVPARPLFHVVVLRDYEERSLYVEVDAKSGDIVEVIDGSARDEWGNLEWEEADEALREELFELLCTAAPIEAKQAA